MSELIKWCLICGSALLLITIFLVVMIKRKFNNKIALDFYGLLEGLGGSNNISNVTLNGSRISLNFTNKKNINKEIIKQNGVESIVISNKKITLVIGKQAPIIYKYLKTNIGN